MLWNNEHSFRIPILVYTTLHSCRGNLCIHSLSQRQKVFRNIYLAGPYNGCFSFFCCDSSLFSFIIYTGIIGGAIAGLGNLYTALAGSIGATERIQELLDRDQEVYVEDNMSTDVVRFDGNIFSNRSSK